MAYMNSLRKNILWSLGLIGTLGLTTLAIRSVSPEIHKGKYKGFPAQASIEGKTKKVILQSTRNYPHGRIIGADYPNVRNKETPFKSIDTLYLAEDDPVRELANLNDLEKAWKKVYSE